MPGHLLKPQTLVYRKVHHHTGGVVNVLNLVEGREVIIESPENSFDYYIFIMQKLLLFLLCGATPLLLMAKVQVRNAQQ
jgi:hypothetical protein